MLEATGERVVGLQGQAGPRGFLHLPVELIVVVVNFPPEVEPGESEAEGANQEQEPQAFPLQEQSRAEDRVTKIITASQRHIGRLPQEHTARSRAGGPTRKQAAT